MITTPEDFNLGFTKLEGFPKDFSPVLAAEDIDRGRVGFINRKQDRFTFSARYFHKGETTTGKFWGKWRTYNAFSATIKNGRLNLFVVGTVGGKLKFPQVVNITRQPYLLGKAFNQNPHIMGFLQKEFASLYSRNNLQPIFTSDEGVFIEELVQACYPAWYTVKRNIIKSNPMAQIPIPPLFATDIMREPTIESAVERLTSKTEPKLKEIIVAEPEKFLTVDTIWMLALSRKRLPEEERIKLLHNLSLPMDKSFLDTGELPSNTKLTADDIAQARSLLKTLSTTQFLSVLSEPLSETLIRTCASDWKLNKVNFKKAGLTLTQPENADWSTISKAIKKLTIKAYPTADKELQSSIHELLRKLHDNSNGVFKPLVLKSEAVNLRSSIHDRYDSSTPMSSRPSSAYMAPNLKLISYSLLFPTEFDVTKSTYYSILSKLNLNKARKDGGQSISLSGADYYNFLEGLLEEATTSLEKYHIESTPENVALYVSSLHALTHSYLLRRFHGVLPPKWFNLIRKGAPPFNALLCLEKRISVKTAVSFNDVPPSWTLQAFGVEEDYNNAF